MHQRSRFIQALSAAGIASLALIPAPASSVELYGIADVYMASTKPSGAASSVLGVESGGMTTSFWGMTGTEDLGNGMKANFRLEGYFLTDTGAGGRAPTDGLFTRNAYAGLEGTFGEFRVGRLSNPMFLATSQFDPFVGSTKFSPLQVQLWTPTFGRYISGDTGWSNAFGYFTPEFGGLSGRFVYGLGEAAGTNSTNNAVAMLYLDRGNFTATAAFQRTRVGPGLPSGSWAQNVVTTAMAYDFRWAKVFLQYNGTRTSGASFRTDSFQLGASIPFLSGKFMLSAVQTNVRAPGQADVKHRGAGVGYLYAMSRRTDVYANVLYDKLSNAGTGITTGVGIRHKF